MKVKEKNKDGFSNILFSVLIANYNNGRYLQDAIDSVLAQTYTNWEVILVDDNSIDNSFVIYEKYKNDIRFHIYYNDENKGCGYTKRRCVELANGRICAFLDPDDTLAGDDAIDIMVRRHYDNPEVAMIYSNYYQVDENLNVINSARNSDIAESETILETAAWPVFHWVSFKKSYYDKTDGIDSFMRRAVDIDLYYKLEEVGRLLHINEYLYKYRVNAGSISMNDNMYKSHIWHSYSCINAMKRRGFLEEKLMLFPVEYDLKTEFENGEKRVQNTKSYRIGRFLTYPFRWAKRITRATKS